MAAYQVRPATLGDTSALVRHRIAMFVDMGIAVDEAPLAEAFREWLALHMAQGTYRAWVVEEPDGAVVAGGGIAIQPWPPGPRDVGGQLPIVYNVYTEPGHRGRGLGRAVMDAIHAWCREAGFPTIGLAASAAGRPLYESLGYRLTPQPFMFLGLR